MACFNPAVLKIEIYYFFKCFVSNSLEISKVFQPTYETVVLMNLKKANSTPFATKFNKKSFWHSSLNSNKLGIL